jgi:glutamine amidotransferase
VRAFCNERERTSRCHSLALLKPRGGEIGPHADGWGVAFYEGGAARIFKEPIPAAESRCLAFITEYDFKSEVVIAHIRKANPRHVGRASANTHPFEREWNGRSWVFAHNGKLPGLRDQKRFALNRFRPLGDTDSEHAFCLIMEAIAKMDDPAGRPLSGHLIVERLQPVVDQLARLGPFNFLLSNGESLIAHAHTRLHALRRNCAGECATCDVVLLATSPLTDEPWMALEPSSIHVYAGGREVTVPTELPAPGLRVAGTDRMEFSQPIGELQ